MTIVDTAAIFAESARRAFAAAYPDRPAKLSHGLVGHSLLTLDALAALAEGEGSASATSTMLTAHTRGLSPD